MKIQFKEILFVLFILGMFVNPTLALANEKSVIDMYRSDQISAEYIREKFGKNFDKVSDMLSSRWVGSEKYKKNINGKLTSIAAGIKKHGDFSFINISIVTYPGDKVIYYTVDLVDKKDAARNQGFLPKQTQDIPDPDHLIKDWLEYEKMGTDLAFNKHKIIKVEHCPVFHCLYGFEYPALKKYGEIFNAKVPQYQAQLVDILRNDKDEHKRGAAAYLLAHIKNEEELVKVLAPSIHDSSSYVRNNTMRTLGGVLEKVKTTDFPILDAISALDYPNESDRNKALYVVLSAVKQPAYAHFVINNASKNILDNLKMLQPNLHGNAYELLQKLSNEKYGDRDYLAWDKWLREHKG